jgi:hypothetical protein
MYQRCVEAMCTFGNAGGLTLSLIMRTADSGLNTRGWILFELLICLGSMATLTPPSLHYFLTHYLINFGNKKTWDIARNLNPPLYGAVG